MKKKLIVTSIMLVLFASISMAQTYRAASEKEADEQFQKAWDLMNNGDHEKAFYWLKVAAENRHADAQFYLAEAYRKGLGTNSDPQQAVTWYRIAAENWHITATETLGWCYYSGYGVDKNYAEAVKWFKRISQERVFKRINDEGNEVQEGYTQSCIATRGIGLCYMEGGYGIAQDFLAAEEWLKKALHRDAGFSFLIYGDLAILYSKYMKNYSEAYRYAALNKKEISKENIPILESHPIAIEGLVQYYEGNVVQAKKLWKQSIGFQGQYYEKEQDMLHIFFYFPEKMLENLVSDDYVDGIITESSSMAQNTFAVVIGNEKYDNEATVPYAHNDAEVFKMYCNKVLDIPESNIRLEKDASYNGIRRCISWLRQVMQVCNGKGKAFFYYAGHGIPDEKDNSAYLLPIDGIGNDPMTAYPLNELYQQLGNMEAENITVFLDACFSGAKREGGMLTATRGVAIKTKNVAPVGNLIVLSAAQGDETAHQLKDRHHGLFTYYLLKKLKESEGNVDMKTLSDYIIQQVERQSVIINNKKQTPTVIPSKSLVNSWQNIKLK